MKRGRVSKVGMVVSSGQHDAAPGGCRGLLQAALVGGVRSVVLNAAQWCWTVLSGLWCEGCRRAMTFAFGPGPLPAWRAPEKKVRPLLPPGGTYG